MWQSFSWWNAAQLGPECGARPLQPAPPPLARRYCGREPCIDGKEEASGWVPARLSLTHTTTAHDGFARHARGRRSAPQARGRPARLQQPAPLRVARLGRAREAVGREEGEQQVADHLADVKRDGAHARKLGVDHVRGRLASRRRAPCYLSLRQLALQCKMQQSACRSCELAAAAAQAEDEGERGRALVCMHGLHADDRTCLNTETDTTDTADTKRK
jgi:hypothetical protein